MSYIDLSHQITKDTPVYPGDPKVAITTAGTLTKDGFSDSLLTFGTHVGTHIDAPAHMIKDGKTLDQYPLERFIGRAIILDIRMDIPQLAGVDAVFFYTGASDRFAEESYWHEYEVITQPILKELTKHTIGMVGVDTCSVDDQDDFPVHKELLSHDILIIENLANLKGLVGKTVEFTALPLSVALDGAPCRVIAKI